MEPERWSRINDLVAQALEHPAEERSARLAAACPDPELRRDAEALLAQDSGALSFLECPPLPLVDRSADVEPGRWIGPYRVSRLLGKGGMGVIYLAERGDREYERRVAIKVLKRGIDTAEIIRRFRTERQILANLKHPGIAELYEGGTTEDGRPYFVLEHVEGEPIVRYCDERRLSIHRRLELFRRVCEAVSFAHQSLVVHRDIKPANILVDTEGQPKLLDFGIAKLLDPEAQGEAPQTGLHQRLMTLDYASPEQVEGEAVTTATDIYALGVLLYELLTGRYPYRLGVAGAKSSFAARCAAICETDPVEPSVAVTRRLQSPGAPPPEALSRVRGEEPARLRRRLAGDLDSIVLKAMAKDPRHRYASVEELAADVERHMEGLPIRARKSTLAYRLGKLVRRRAKELVLAAVTVGALAGVWADRELQQRRTIRALDRAERVTELLVDLFKVSDPSEARGNSITAREVLDRGADRVRSGLTEEPEVQAALLHTLGTVYHSLGLYDAAEPLLREALVLRRRVLGGDHPEVAETLAALGVLLSGRGDLQGAEGMLRQALSRSRARFGPDSLQAAEHAHELARVLQVRGATEEAGALYRQVFETRLGRLGTDHPQSVDSLNDLASELLRNGRATEAEKLLREVLETRRRLLGPAHPDVVKSLNNLAVCLEYQGSYGEAEELYREALDRHRRLLGEDHPDAAKSAATLGRFLVKRGSYREAESLLRDALARHRHTLGSSHLEVSSDLRELAVLLQRTGRYEEGRRMLRDALAIARSTLGEEHLAVAVLLNNLGALLVELGDAAAAEEVLLRALATYRQVLGPESPRGTSPLHHLGSVYRLRGDYETAERYYREALEIRRKAHGDAGPPVAVSLVHLARLAIARGRPADAEAMAREALAIYRSQAQPHPRRIAQAESVLGAAMSHLGRFAEAEALLVRSYPVLRARLSDRSSYTREAREHLASLYRAWGRPWEATRFRARPSGLGSS